VVGGQKPGDTLLPIVMRKFLIQTMVICALLASATAQRARGKPPTGGRIATRTRLVALYSDLEAQLASAAQKQDRAKLEQLLGDDFEQWSPEPPGDPVPREDWMAGYHPVSFGTRQVAVRAFPDMDVVSFVLRQQAKFGDNDASGDFFVVDVWRHEGTGQKLASRYISRAAKASVQPASPSGKR